MKRFVSPRAFHVVTAILVFATFALICAPASGDTGPSPAAVEFFEKQVRPLLADQCFGCHGSAASGANGGLRMVGRDDLLKGGARGPAIVPGHPETSLLIKAIAYTDNKLSMPPRSRLTDPQIAILTEWIKNGAAWPSAHGASTPGVRVFNLQARKASHWAWQPVKRSAVPAVKNRAWVSSPIDAFILAKLEAKGISPAKSIDRRTLIRRVTFDLIGLPPTPDEVNAFLADRSPDAYAHVVDRLLASPHYGERWARHWLDLVRYAETDGHEFDLEKPGAWQYRDYVIRAFNADVNYKQFALEQLAGDLISNPRLNPTEHYNESILGTGFYWLGSGTHSPVDLLDDQADHMDNEIDVLSKSFLGIGVGCARCHDHKFDAVSQKDYYGLFGILKTTRRQIVPVGPPPDPKVVSDLQFIHTEMNRTLEASAAEQFKSGAGLKDTRWKPVLDAAKNDPTSIFYPWVCLCNVQPDRFVSERDAVLKRLTDQKEQSEREARAIEWFNTPERKSSAFPEWTATGAAFGNTANRGDLDARLGGSTPGVTSAFCASIADSGELSDKLHGAVRSATFTITKTHVLYRMAGHGAKLRLIVDGLLQLRDPLYGGLLIEPNSDAMKWYEQDVSRWIGHRAYIELQDIDPGFIALDRVGFSDGGTPHDPPNPIVCDMLKRADITNGDNLDHIYRVMFNDALVGGPALAGDRDNLAVKADAVRWAPLSKEAEAKISELEKRRAALEAQIPVPQQAMAAADGNGENERVHLRGNYRTPGAPAPRRFLEACDGPVTLADATGCGRLELAEKITSPTDPLFARVMVNRLWQHHFGEGIVRTPDDFGFMGQRPTHPELLDWLANEFVRGGWSIKRMQRMMVLSNTYKMDSRADAKAEAADPQNLLLHRMPVRRLEAECIRDSILAVSGRLDGKVCGPPVMPHLDDATPGRGAPSSGPIDGDGRRSIYISVRRGFPVPMLTAFDLPVPMTTIGRRSVSSVPAQALALLNDPFVVEQAGVWAKRMVSQAATPEQRITAMFETAFSRPPDPSELAAALAFVKGRTDAVHNPSDQQSWADMAHVLFNVKEFIFIR